MALRPGVLHNASLCLCRLLPLRLLPLLAKRKVVVLLQVVQVQFAAVFFMGQRVSLRTSRKGRNGRADAEQPALRSLHSRMTDW